MVPLEERQDGMVAGGLVIWGSVIGICRHHHILIAHEIDIEWHVDGKLQNVEEEDIGSIDRAGETANVGVVHFSQVAVELIEHDGLIQITRDKVGSARGSEGNSQRLGQWVELHRQQCRRVVAVGSEWDLHSGY